MEKGTYGRVYQEVMRNPNLPGNSKLIYAYLAAFAGNENECYPSVETICKELNMTKTTMYKYMTVLIDHGVIEKKQTYIGNLKNKVIYSITHKITENVRIPKNSETEKDTHLVSEEIGIRTIEKSSKSERKSNNINNNNINKKNNKYIVEQDPTYPVKEVIDYLNQRTGKHYKYSSEVTQKHIKARFREGFTLEDFKRVIDWKKSQWTGTDMEIYLRPQTLFGTKFESYLNEIPKPRQETEKPPEEPEQPIDYSNVERKW